MPTRIIDKNGNELLINSDGSISGVAITGDVEIGAVELKNAADDTRAVIGTPAGIADSANLVGVYAPLKAVRVAGSYTRPNDTTAYAALDVISDSTSAPTVLSFTGMARANGYGGKILKAQLMTDQKTNTARFRLHLFNQSPTAINDNSPYLSLWANRAIRVGALDFPACATEDPTNSTQAYAQNITTVMEYLCDAADSKLYGILETLDAFTPAAQQNFYVALSADLN